MVNKMDTSPEPPKVSAKRHKTPSSTTKNKFYCDTCDVHCPNASTLAQHNTGKKHQSNVNNALRRDKHAMSSIFVGNLPKLAKVRAKLTAEGAEAGKENEKLKSDLQALFGQFGQINKIIIDKNHGSFCIIEYSSPTMAQAVLKEYLENRIPKFYDKKLQIKSRKVTEITPLNKIVSHNQIQLDNITALLQEAEDEPEFGLAMVDNAVRVSDQLATRRYDAVKRIKNQLNEHFPFHKIDLALYGSSATELALLDSDLDLSLSVGTGNRLERDDLVAALKQKCTGISHVHVIPAPGGKITRFMDGISGTMCDVLFTNRLGIANTKFLQTLLSYDQRLTRLVRLLIYWNKVVLGAKFAKQHIPSSYTITIMVLHYLRHAGIIPDLFDEGAMTALTDTQLIYDLDCSHVTDISKLTKSDNTDNIVTLMKGYFQYYGHVFDMDERVVSVRSTSGVEKCKLYLTDETMQDDISNTSANMTNTYVTMFKQSTLAVQDPFVLTHNIAHNVSLECAVMFRDLCRSAVVDFTQVTPLHRWLFNVSTSYKRKQVETVDKVSDIEVSDDEVSDDEGNKTPLWNEEGVVTSGTKRSVESMEH